MAEYSDGKTKSSSSNKYVSKILRIVIPIVISVGLCYMLFNGIDLDEMILVIKHDCDFSWIIFGMILSVIAQIIRALRWQIQLRALEINVPLFPVVLSIFGTYAVNLVFPRLGEIWRTGYIASRQKSPFSIVFGSMVADRIADLILVGIIALITFSLASSSMLAFVERYPAFYDALISIVCSPFTWIALFIGIILLWRIYVHYSHRTLMTKLRTVLLRLWEGFAVVLHMKGRIAWCMLSLILWGCYFMQLYVAFFSFTCTRELLAANGMICALVCFVLSSMAMAVPSNGGIGPWQLAVIFALTLFAPSDMSVEAAEAFRINVTAFANIVMGMETLLLIVLGLFTFICVFFDKQKDGAKDREISSVG